MKKIKVDIVQCLSSTQTIEVPDDFDYDPTELEAYVIDQVILPSDCLEINGHLDWIVDELCIIQ